ncbi:uncharacterized protein LOC115465589 isoform X2 [Microcaecilia unicolor]|uniref:Uncharacterized protein LOC115465589 isoform X2 n=1 Tax=Microcaecilia unicolor TaxID=1415580 RepID=A0A6P7X8U6_9AMPH|nr:uncharacterized protein LOC115465589 isoform X2 [Microcaecilia unicolor]
MKQVFFFTLFCVMSLLLAKQLSEEISKATFRDKAKLANEKDNFVQLIEKQRQLESAQPPMLVYVPVTSCHLFLSQDFGEFSPPVHTDNSLTNIWCNWTIWAGPGKHIVVYIKNFIANEDCDKNEDKIVFEGVLSTVENTVVYACWNKITHMFAAQALAVHVVFLSSSSSHKHAGKYFHGSYYIFKDYGTDVAVHCPLLSSIVLPTPVREIKSSNDTKLSTKIPLLSSITDAVKLKETKHSHNTNIFMQKSPFSLFTSATIIKTVSSGNLETASEQSMLPSLPSPIDYISVMAVNIQQTLETINHRKTHIPQLLLTSKSAPVSLSKMDDIGDIKPNAQTFFFQSVPTSVTGANYIIQTNVSQSLLASTSPSTLLKMDYVGDIKGYTLPVQLEEVNGVKDPKVFIEQYLRSVTVPMSVKEMAYSSDTMVYSQHLLSSVTVSTFGNEIDYVHDTTPCTWQSFYFSVPAFASRWATDYISDIDPSIKFLLYPVVAPVTTKELLYVSDTRPYTPLSLFSTVATSAYIRKMSAYETSVQPLFSSSGTETDYMSDSKVSLQPLFSSILVPTVSMEVSILNDLKASTKEIDYLSDIKPSLDQTFHSSITASTSVRDVNSSSVTEAYTLYRLFPSMMTHLKEINCIGILETTERYFLSTIGIAASVKKTYDITESKAATGLPWLASVVAPTAVMETDLISKNKSSIQPPFFFPITYLSGEANNVTNPKSHTEHATYRSMEFSTVPWEETSAISSIELEHTHAYLTIEEKYFKTKTNFLILSGLNEKQNSFNTASYWETIYSDWLSKTNTSTPYLIDPIKPADIPNAGTILQSKVLRNKLGIEEANELTSLDELKLNSGETSADHVTFPIVQMSQTTMDDLKEQTVLSTRIKSFSSVTSNRHSEVLHLNHSVYKGVISPSLLSNIQPVTEIQTGIFSHLQFKSVAVGTSKEKSYPGSPYEESEPAADDIHLVFTAALEHLKVLTLENSRLNDLDKMDLKVATMAANSILKDELSTGVSVSYHKNILNMGLQQILPSRTVPPLFGSLLARAEVQQQVLQDEENMYAPNVSHNVDLENLSTSSEELLHFQDAKKLSLWVPEDVSTMIYSENNISKYHTINESSDIFAQFRAWLNYQVMKAYEHAREYAFHRFRNQNEDVTPPLREVNEIHINDKPNLQILPSSPFSKLEKSAGWSRLSTDLGMITHRKRTSHYSFSDMVSQMMTPLETRDDQYDFDVLFKVIIEIEYQGLIPNTSNEAEKDLLEFTTFKIKEKLSVLSRHVEIVLESKSMKTRNMVVSFWIHLKPETGNKTQEVKSQLDTLTNSTLGNETATLVSISVEDVDECRLTIHVCDKQAACLNEFGTYSCHCKRGYEDRSPAASGTLCVSIQQSDFGFFNYLEILIVVPLCAILLLVTVVALLCGIAQKKHTKMVLNLEKRHSPEKDPAEISNQSIVPVPHMYTSEHLSQSSFPRAQLSIVEELSEEFESKRISISMEQTAC